MKKILSAFLAVLLVFSLCSCGSVDIGPLTFNFGRVGTNSGFNSSNVSSAPSQIVATDAPAAEIAPFEPAEEAYADFDMEFHSMFYGNFAENGAPEYMSNIGSSPYLLVSFTFKDIYDIYGMVYVDCLEIDGEFYPMVDPYANEKHFVNNIDRYFGYEYTYDGAEVTYGEAKAFACFPLDDKAFAMIEAGMECYIYVCSVQVPIMPEYIENLDEILFGEMYYGYSYEGAHAAATLLWSLDFSHHLLDGILCKTQEYGDTGVFDDYSEPEHLNMIYRTGTHFSPSVTPILETGFCFGHASIPFEFEMAAEKYPEIVEIAFEYVDLCSIIADLSYSTGNYQEVIDMINYAHELYFLMGSILMEVYGIQLWYY